jgi:hypothetical protein
MFFTVSIHDDRLWVTPAPDFDFASFTAISLKLIAVKKGAQSND